MMRLYHAVWQWFGGCVMAAAWLAGHSHAAEILVKDLPHPPWNENVEIYVGDTVTWVAGLAADTESYTGEWKSPILGPGESFSHTFSEPGRYIYRIGWYTRVERTAFVGNRLGTITVRPLVGSRPAVSIVSPPDGFVFQFRVLLEAVVTNSAANVQAVHFFVGEQLVGTDTNAPFRARASGFGDRPGVYEFRAVEVDRAGNTNSSPPVRLTAGVEGGHVFAPLRLPGGQFVFNFAAGTRQRFVFWSEDLKTWRSLEESWSGYSTVLDLRATNAIRVRRFYRVIPGPF